MTVPVLGADSDAVEARIPAFYSTKSPVQLLEELTVLHKLNPNLKGNLTLPNLTTNAIRNWLTVEQLRALIKLVDDDTRCLRAVTFLSSNHVEGASIVGKEACRMILGAMDGAYPPVTPYGIERAQLETKLNRFLEKSGGTRD